MRCQNQHRHWSGQRHSAFRRLQLVFSLTPDWLGLDLAQELARLARLRNMLIHQYEDVRPEQVYESSARSAPLWRQYLEAILQKRED
jgi:hypothetical protein